MISTNTDLTASCSPIFSPFPNFIQYTPLIILKKHTYSAMRKLNKNYFLLHNEYPQLNYGPSITQSNLSGSYNKPI